MNVTGTIVNQVDTDRRTPIADTQDISSGELYMYEASRGRFRVVTSNAFLWGTS